MAIEVKKDTSYWTQQYKDGKLTAVKPTPHKGHTLSPIWKKLGRR